MTYTTYFRSLINVDKASVEEDILMKIITGAIDVATPKYTMTEENIYKDTKNGK